MKGDNYYRRESSKEEKENKGKVKKEKEEDRLTKLPDEIILHILSFVDAKTAVQTSVLNKRYRYLWASLPVLNFVDSFHGPEFFEAFIRHFLAYRDTSINIFNVNLKCLYSFDDEYLVDYIVVDSIIEHIIDTPSVTTTIQVFEKAENMKRSKNLQMNVDNIYERDSSKKQEKNKEKEEDMLTELPEEIILHILSFVDAKTAVQTSVLNKRCRYLWASLPVFNFDDSSFQNAIFFKDFVDDFLSCRDTSTNVFNVYLDCHHVVVYNDDHVVDSIIEHVIDTPSITTTIEVLTILAEYVVSKLPKLSVCSSLTTLKLCQIFSQTTNFDFPSLKRLYLCHCQFECEFIQHPFDPFNGCVNLESLNFDSCVYYLEIKTFKISTPTL
ncbi:F-box/FBD/LRR-repeat protein At5g22660-like [Vigna radiata var. radiata]|uniref:F-box/FBD/LRR-repeat protein At5g22660-like n=1 Tax=Vigna radiata var. radiata TaxID=3916 RepID=A0A1S3UA66_VIGRR|nr:F-box/FBD/LRR-repeat protein At5g22660-like [Vigna radiata var. radiata]